MKLTNKEASEWLMAIKRDYIHGGDEDYDKRRKLALDMGAEALESQKTGYWKKISPAGIMECSVCGGNVLTSDIECYKYCHHCGAKME